MLSLGFFGSAKSCNLSTFCQLDRENINRSFLFQETETGCEVLGINFQGEHIFVDQSEKYFFPGKCFNRYNHCTGRLVCWFKNGCLGGITRPMSGPKWTRQWQADGSSNFSHYPHHPITPCLLGRHLIFESAKSVPPFHGFVTRGGNINQTPIFKKQKQVARLSAYLFKGNIFLSIILRSIFPENYHNHCAGQ